MSPPEVVDIHSVRECLCDSLTKLTYEHNIEVDRKAKHMVESLPSLIYEAFDAKQIFMDINPNIPNYYILDVREGLLKDRVGYYLTEAGITWEPTSIWGELKIPYDQFIIQDNKLKADLELKYYLKLDALSKPPPTWNNLYRRVVTFVKKLFSDF